MSVPLQAALKVEGVETIIHYPVPPHLQQTYADLGQGRGVLPLPSGSLMDEVLSPPMAPHLTDDQLDTVIGGIRKAIAE